MTGQCPWYWHRRMDVTDNDRSLSLILPQETGRYWQRPANIIHQTCGHCSNSRSVSTTTEFGPWQRHIAYSCEMLYDWTSCPNPLQSKQINPSRTVGFNSEYCRQWSRSILVLNWNACTNAWRSMCRNEWSVHCTETGNTTSIKGPFKAPRPKQCKELHRTVP